MSFGSDSDLPSQPTKPLGVDSKRFSTSEARPAPWWRGRAQFGLTFISGIFDVVKQTVTTKTGKEEVKTGVNYYGSLAALIGIGPLKQTPAIMLNDQVVYGGRENFAGADYKDIVATKGAHNWHARVYAGTETQTPDDYLNSFGLSHPAYRGFAYIVFKRMFFGFNQTDAPNCEVMADCLPPIGWLTSPVSPWPFYTKGENPIAIIADALQHPRASRALPDAKLDVSSLNDAAGQLDVEKHTIFSYVDRQQEVRSAIDAALQACDGFLFVTPGGKLGVKLNRPPIDPEDLPVVDELAFVRKPERDAGDWLTAKSETRLKWLNPGHGDEPPYEQWQIWRDRGLVRITGEPNAQTVERLNINSFSVGKNTLNAYGRRAALPESSGRLVLRKMGTLFDDLLPGALFRLDYPSRGIVGQVCRVQDRTEDSPGKPQFSIAYKVDLSWLNAGDPIVEVAETGEIGEGEDGDPADNTFEAARVIELPLALCPGGQISLCALVRRDSSQQEAYATHLKRDYDFDGAPADSYVLLGAKRNFALHGTIVDACPVGDVVDTVGFRVTLDGFDLELGAGSVFDGVSDELLLFIDGEVMSVYRADLEELNVYRVYCLRGRYGTAVAAHDVAADAFIIERARLEPLSHAQFDVGNTATLKLAGITGGAQKDLSTITPIVSTIEGRIYREPALANLRVNGTAPAHYANGDDVVIEWTITLPEADWIQERRFTRTVVVELLVADVVVSTDETPAGSLRLMNAQLQDRIGGEVSFVARAKLRTAGDFFNVYSEPISVAVTKI